MCASAFVELRVRGLQSRKDSASPSGGSVQDYRKLKVWQKAHALTLFVYRVTESLPRGERAGLCSQLRRAAASASANIAEGCGRDSAKDLAKFLQISLASVAELEYHSLLARDLGLIASVDHTRLASRISQVRAMLYALIRRVRQNAAEKADSKSPSVRVSESLRLKHGNSATR